jgi:hypothetical protein
MNSYGYSRGSVIATNKGGTMKSFFIPRKEHSFFARDEKAFFYLNKLGQEEFGI